VIVIGIPEVIGGMIAILTIVYAFLAIARSELKSIRQAAAAYLAALLAVIFVAAVGNADGGAPNFSSSGNYIIAAAIAFALEIWRLHNNPSTLPPPLPALAEIPTFSQSAARKPLDRAERITLGFRRLGLFLSAPACVLAVGLAFASCGVFLVGNRSWDQFEYVEKSTGRIIAETKANSDLIKELISRQAIETTWTHGSATLAMNWLAGAAASLIFGAVWFGLMWAIGRALSGFLKK
jgi:Ca2+/Na+ antiporter